MKPPKRITVGLHEYRLIVDDVGLVGDHGDNRGSTHNETLTIALDGRLHLSLLQETCLHEVMHAAWDQTALTSLDVQEDQEVIVNGLAPLLLDVLRRNPRLVAYLTS